MSFKRLSPGQAETVFSGQAVAASGSSTSDVIDLSALKTGEFGVQWSCTHTSTTGRLKIELLTSVNNQNFITYSPALASAWSKTSGDGSGNGVAYVSGLQPASIKIKISETGTSEAITSSVWVVGR